MNSIKKFTVVLVSILAVTMTVGVFTSQPAQARATIFITPNNCGMIDAGGENVNVGVLDREIVTQSSNNNITWICKAEFDNPTGKAIRYDAINNPFPDISPLHCEDPFGNRTTDWKEVISASGQATMICHFKS